MVAVSNIHNSTSLSAAQYIWDQPVFPFLFCSQIYSCSFFLEENDALNVHYPVKFQHITKDANSWPSQSLFDVLFILPLFFLPWVWVCSAHSLLGLNAPRLVYLGTQRWGGLIWHSLQSFSVCATAGLGFHSGKCGEDYWGYFIMFFKHFRKKNTK